MQGQKIFYGWFVVAACFMVTATVGEAFYSFGVFFKPLENDFGWSRSIVSSAFTTFVIGYCISAVIGGRLADRSGPRFILLSSAFLIGTGLALCTQVNSINQLRIFLFIAGLGSGATLAIPTAIVQRWFQNRRSAGTALAVVMTGIGVGQMVFTPLINYFVESYGWRNAYLITGILFFSTIAIASLIISPSPADAADYPIAKSGKPVSTEGWTTRKAILTHSYAGIIYAACAVVLAWQTIVVHLVPHATDLGLSSTAAAALGLVGGLSIFGRLTSGFISNRIGWQKLLGLSLFGMAISVTWLIFLDNSWMLYGFVFLFGIFSGMRSVAQFGILGEYFGLRSIGAIIGISTAVANIFGAGAPYFAGFIFDTTGSYFLAFTIMAVLLFSGGFVIAMMKKPLMATRNDYGEKGGLS